MKYLLLLLLSVPAFAAAPAAGVWGWDGTHYYPSLGLGSVLQGGTGSSVGEMIVNGGPQIKKYAANTIGAYAGSTDRPVVVSGGAPTYGLMIVRGQGETGTTNISGGEGYAYSSNTTAQQTLSFSVSFGDTPVCTCTVGGSTGYSCTVVTVSSSGFSVYTFQTYNTPVNDVSYNFICIGQRPSGS